MCIFNNNSNKNINYQAEKKKSPDTWASDVQSKAGKGWKTLRMPGRPIGSPALQSILH